MRRLPQRAPRLLRALLGLLLLSGSAGTAAPAAAGPAFEERWEEQLAEAEARSRATRERLERAEAAYAEARHANDPRGDALARLGDARQAARRDHREAAQQLAELVDRARGAGVSTSLLLRYTAQLDRGAAAPDPAHDVRSPRGDARPHDPNARTPHGDADSEPVPAP